MEEDKDQGKLVIYKKEIIEEAQPNSLFCIQNHKILTQKLNLKSQNHLQREIMKIKVKIKEQKMSRSESRNK